MTKLEEVATDLMDTVLTEYTWGGVLHKEEMMNFPLSKCIIEKLINLANLGLTNRS